MKFNRPTFHVPPTVPSLGVGSSRWRSPKDLTTFFLGACYGHLPPGPPIMFRIEEIWGNGGLVIGIVANITNPFVTYHLIGHGFYCGCEFIVFTGFNIITDFEKIFPVTNVVHFLCALVMEEEE
ncbi:unnamed protein product [Alopecurus aequalis]